MMGKFMFLGFTLLILLNTAFIILHFVDEKCSAKEDMLDEVFSYDAKDCEITRRDAIITGQLKSEKAFIAIGIPVIHREHNSKTAFYLDQTLKSLINPLTRKDKEDLQIILFLVDESTEKRQSVFTKIINLFEKEIEAGLMTIVGVPKRYYLRLENLPPTYRNSPDRMYWRSKQALDYAYIFNYASNLCKYFMQLEDDVIASPNYLNVILKDIRDLNSRQNREIGQNKWDEKPIHPQPWLTKIYYRMGFIGRVIPSHFLPFFSTWIRVYYAHFPVDLEITYLFQTYKDYKEEDITAELFTHIGAQSSSLGT